MAYYLGKVADQTKAINAVLGRPYQGIDMCSKSTPTVEKLWKKASLTGTQVDYIKVEAHLDRETLDAIRKVIWDPVIPGQWGNIVCYLILIIQLIYYNNISFLHRK